MREVIKFLYDFFLIIRSTYIARLLNVPVIDGEIKHIFISERKTSQGEIDKVCHMIKINDTDRFCTVLKHLLFVYFFLT